MSRLATSGRTIAVVTLLTGLPAPRAHATQPENPKPVEVVNTPSVAVVDNAHRAFMRRGECPFADGDFSCGDTMEIPAGTRLVIEAFSVQAFVPSGQRAFVVLRTGRRTAEGTEYVRHMVPLTPQGQSISGDSIYAGFESSRLYSDHGAGDVAIAFEARRNDTVGTGNVSWSVSGYLVDCGPSGDGCPVQ
jgi:hypothetical protein